jgi:hypothetical protein
MLETVTFERLSQRWLILLPDQFSSTSRGGEKREARKERVASRAFQRKTTMGGGARSEERVTTQSTPSGRRQLKMKHCELQI